MPPVRGSAPPGLARYAITAALAAMFVAHGAINALVQKSTPTGESATRNIWCARSSSGSGLCIHEDGSVTASGSIVANGITLSGSSGGGFGTGNVMTITNARFVQKQGGTMTGALTVNLTSGTVGIKVLQTISGSTVHADKILQSSGSVVAAGDIWTDGAHIGSGTILKRYMTIPLTGSGTATATGTNVFGDYVFRFGGKIISASAHMSQTASNNLTTIDAKINGTSIFSTTITIDATEKDTSTAAAANAINSAANSFVSGDVLTFNVNAPATTPGKDLKVDLVLLLTSP